MNRKNTAAMKTWNSNKSKRTEEGEKEIKRRTVQR
jgi:hypothetical protein